jgi:DNA repair exonuclease SbcCD ATPase subunit
VQFDDLHASIKAKQKELKEAEAKLQETMKESPMYKDIQKYRAELKSFIESHKVFLDKIATVLSQIEGNTVKQRDRLWKLTQETREARTPTYVAILGQLENELRTTVPTIKSTLDRLWLEMRSIISVKKLVVEKPESKEEYVVTEKQTSDLPAYTPPKEEKGAGAGGMKRFADAISDYITDIFTNIARIDKAIDEAEKFI